MARVIENKVVEALKYGLPLSVQNTVVIHDDITKVYLHGNCIFVIDGNKIRWSDCGWATVTSSSRINACLSYVNATYGTTYRYNRRGGCGKVLDGNGNEMPHEITLY